MARNRTEREVRGAGLVLQTVWGYKDLRRTLEKDGWKKTDFMVNLNPPSNNTRANGGYEDSTLPLIDKGQEAKREAREHKANNAPKYLQWRLSSDVLFSSQLCLCKSIICI